jgi:hypothetical protein
MSGVFAAPYTALSQRTQMQHVAEGQGPPAQLSYTFWSNVIEDVKSIGMALRSRLSHSIPSAALTCAPVSCFVRVTFEAVWHSGKS